MLQDSFISKEQLVPFFLVNFLCVGWDFPSPLRPPRTRTGGKLSNQVQHFLEMNSRGER